MLLNNDLLDDKDRTLYRLKACIKKFKAYDKERTKLLHKIQEDLEDYSEKYLLIRNCIGDKETFAALNRKISDLKTNLAGVTRANENYKKQLELIDNPKLLKKAEDALKNLDVVALGRENEDLKKQVSRLREQVSLLVTENIQLKNKTK